ncbi:MAG: type II toxin-antitoxin system HigB family toxin [Planctomycetota bacterium]
MRIIARSTLIRYASLPGRSAVRRALDDWHRVAADADWPTPHAIKASFGNASIINRDRVVFNIAGNKHRLIASLDYPRRILFILWIGTHAEYDDIDAATVTYERPSP